jgi:uncharacterized phiE125 gp8 family phage protein
VNEYGTKYKVTVEPTEEPVSVDQAKLYLRITHNHENDLIENLIRAARKKIEDMTNRTLMTTTYQLKLTNFPASLYCPIVIPRPPTQSVTSVQYVDTAGTTQTWSSTNWSLDTFEEPSKIWPNFSVNYPSTRGHVNDITVTYVAGYSSSISIPPPIKQAMLSYIGQLYENRESAMTGMISQPIENGLVAMLSSYIVRYF